MDCFVLSKENLKGKEKNLHFCCLNSIYLVKLSYKAIAALQHASLATEAF